MNYTETYPKAGHPLKILHLLSQQPGKTGSGVCLLTMTRLGGEAGFLQRAVIGLPKDAPLPDVPPLSPGDLFPVRFGEPPVPFPIPGMSDIMPYPSTRFSAFTDSMRAGYLEVFAAAMRAAADGFMPDIIHAHHLWLMTALARKQFPDIPLCVYCHGTELRQLQNAPHLAPYVIPGCRAVDRVFALHEENKRQIMEAYGINDERINIVGAGFRADVFRPPDVCVPAVDQKALTVVYAGKISAPKGVPWLIEAMRKVTPPPGKQVRLVLAGSAGDDSARRIQAQATDLPNVIFLGALDQSALGDVLRDADVFVLPSFFEGLPLVVMESLACDCRVVITDLPGSDRWLPKTLCANRVVERVPLPRLVGPDTPAPAGRAGHPRPRRFAEICRRSGSGTDPSTGGRRRRPDPAQHCLPFSRFLMGIGIREGSKNVSGNSGSDGLSHGLFMQHFLYFFPLPQGQGSFLPIFLFPLP